MLEKNTSCNCDDFSCVPAVLDACYSFKKGESENMDGFCGKKLASAMDCTQNVALNKLNPNNEHNTPTLKDAIKLTDSFNDDRILNAWASSRGYLLVKKFNASDVDEEEIINILLELNTNFGKLGDAYREARADGVIEPKEFDLIKHSSELLRKTVAAFEGVIQTQVRELPKLKGVANG